MQLFPPSAAQERRGSAPWEQSRRSREYAPPWCGPGGLFLVQLEELRPPGCSVRRSPWSVVRRVCTGDLLSPWGFVQVAPLTLLSAVVSGHRQCHGDVLLLVTPLSTQPPLPPPPRGSPSVGSSHALLPARVHPLKHHQTHVRGQAWVRRCCCCCFCHV